MIDFFDDLRKIGVDLNSTFKNSLSREFGLKTGSRVPFADVQELESSFLFSVEVPGVSREDVVVEIENNKLLVSGSSKKFVDNCCEDVRGACSVNNFFRSFSIPVNANVEEVSASYDNGILRITVPKKEKGESKRRVDIS